MLTIYFCASSKGALEQWMEVNDWWKDACKDAVHLGQDVESVTNYPPIWKTVVFPDFANDTKRQKFEDAIVFGPSAMFDMSTQEAVTEYVYTAVLAVDGVVWKGKNDDQILELLLKNGSKTLRVIHCDFASIFFSPVLAIDLGLLDVLKFQVEELKLDVTLNRYCGIFFDTSSDDEPMSVPLILHALVQPDEHFLKYILTVESFEVNPHMERNLDGDDILDQEQTFFHELFRILIHKSLTREIDLDRITYILQEKDVDFEVQNVQGHTPLEVLCSRFHGSTHGFDLAKIFLSHGAKVTEFALDQALTCKCDACSTFHDFLLGYK